MKITICGSMSFAGKMADIQNLLEKMGHTVYIPEGTHEYANGSIPEIGGSEGAKRKMAFDLIRKHYALIADSDAILVINLQKRDTENYIGGNSFLEMGFAHILNKKIFLLNPPPDIELIGQEVEAMQPIVLHGDLSKIPSV